MSPDVAEVIASLCAKGATLTVQAHDPLNPGFGFEAVLESERGRQTGSGNTTTAAITRLAIHAGVPSGGLTAPLTNGDVPLGGPTSRGGSIVSEQIIKVCGCGAAYTREGWNALARPERSAMEMEPGEVHLYRHCVCGSTIAVVLAPVLPDPPIDQQGGGRATLSEGWALPFQAKKRHYMIHNGAGGERWISLCSAWGQSRRPAFSDATRPTRLCVRCERRLAQLEVSRG